VQEFRSFVVTAAGNSYTESGTASPSPSPTESAPAESAPAETPAG